MVTHQSVQAAPNTDPHHRKIRVWPIVRQSFSVLFRYVVPFTLLSSGVALAVGLVLFRTGLAPFLVLRNPEFSTLYHRQVASLTLHAVSQVSVEAVIAMVVWLDLGGRRLTLKSSLTAVMRALPGILDRPFYLFVSRVSAVAVLRALLYLPHHAVLVLLLTSALDPGPKEVWLLGLSTAGSLLNALIDSRLLILLPVAAIEGVDVRHSIRRCWQLTAGHWIQILGVLMLVGCVRAAFDQSSTWLLEGAAGYLREHDLFVLLAVGIGLVKGLIRACWAVVATVSYRHTRVANGESTAEQATVSPTP